MNTTDAHGWTFREATDEFVQEILCAYLKVESIAAVLDTDVEQGQSEHGDIGIAVVNVLHNGDGGFARGISLLSIDQVGDLEVEGQVWLEVLRVAGTV